MASVYPSPAVQDILDEINITIEILNKLYETLKTDDTKEIRDEIQYYEAELSYLEREHIYLTDM